MTIVGEFSKMKTSSHDVGCVSFIFCQKVSKVESRAANGDLCHPSLSSVPIEIDALKSAATSIGLSSISKVLTSSGGPKVCSGVIQTIMVAMVNILNFGKTATRSNRSVQIGFYRLRNSGISHGVPNWLGLIPGKCRVPLPLHSPFVVAGVNGGEFTLSERNPVSSVFSVHQFGGPVCLIDDRLTFIKESGNLEECPV